MKTTIYLVRHGDTFKGKEIFWSRKPGRSLNKLGKIQADKAGEYLSQYKISRIFYSPLNRTTQTAQRIRQFLPEAKIAPKKELLEWDIGFQGERVEGKPFEYFFPRGIEKVYDETPTKLIGGELLIEATDRVVSFIYKIVEIYQGKEILCVAHEDVIRSTVLKFRKIDLDKLITIPCEKGSIYKLTFEDKRFIEAKYLDF
jgi:broad specificity phosphatase PhoE